MARNPEDVFAALQVKGDPSAVASRATPDVSLPADGERDVFAAVRIPGPGNTPQYQPRDNTLGEEFSAGLSGGVDSFQGSLFGMAGLVGRELGIDWLETAGNEGAERNFKEAENSGRQSQGFTDIDSAGGFFRWSSATLAEFLPTLGAMVVTGGIGATVAKKAVERGVRRSVARRTERDLVKNFGFSKEEALDSVKRMMLVNGKETERQMRDAFIRGRRVIGPATAKAQRRGGAAGLAAVNFPLQTGQLDQELLAAGIDDPGLTAVVGGALGTALELLPSLRLMDVAFPGVDREMAKTFVKDFAVSVGKQNLIEGGTEAAQEMINIAALAYHDPSFDMYSADSKKRVIDAFAAGALIGTVMGTGAQTIGNIGPITRRIKKVAAPKIESFSLFAQGKAEAAIPAGFVAADNTLFEEIKGRVYGAVQPRIESIVNSMRNQVNKATDGINDSLEGGVNLETAKISDVVKAAHNKFIENHGADIESAKEFLNTQIQFIFNAAKSIKDPVERAQFIDTHVAAAQEKLAGLVERLRQAAARRDQQTDAEVDDIDFSDDILEGFDVEDVGREDVVDETERRTGPSGRKFDRPVGPAPVEAEPLVTPSQGSEVLDDAPDKFVLGKFQKQGELGPGGEVTVRGYDTQEQAQKALDTTVREMFPSANESTFDIRQQEDGSFVIGVRDIGKAEELKGDLIAFEGVKRARKSAGLSRQPLRQFKPEGKVALDIITLAHAGRDLTRKFAGTSMLDGLKNITGRMIESGALTNEEAEAMIAKFQKLKDMDDPVIQLDLAAPPIEYPSEAAAFFALNRFLDGQKEKGRLLPKKGVVGVEALPNGKFTVKITNKRGWRAYRDSQPVAAAGMAKDMIDDRRSEKLSRALKDPEDFGPGTARARTTERIPTAPGRATTPVGRHDVLEADILKGEDKVRPVTPLEDTAPQEDDPFTDPQNLPTEFSDRAEELQRTPETQRAGVVEDPREGTIRGRPSKKRIKADLKETRRIMARAGKAKVLISDLVDPDGAIQKGITGIVKFVQKTLGFGNEIVVMDKVGLGNLIETGLVTDPIFQKTLDDDPAARNIRLRDTSYIYLSDRVLSKPGATVVALGHELGHQLYSVAWDQLTPAKQTALRNAFDATPLGREIDNDFLLSQESNDPDGLAAALDRSNNAFNEWMADQLSTWIVQRRAPRNPVEAFFHSVGAKIRQLYDFLSKNERFQLNTTFKEFADAVADRARGVDPRNEPLAAAKVKAWFANEGGTSHKWWGPLPKVDDMDSDIAGRVPQIADREIKQIRDSFAKRYPEIARRAVLLRNWVHSAYSLVLAPSTSVVRDIGKRVPVVNKLVSIFGRENHGEAKKSSNYHQRLRLFQAQFLEGAKGFDSITKAIQTSVESEAKSRQFPNKRARNKWKQAREFELKRDIVNGLRAKESDKNAVFSQQEQAVRDLFDAMHDYAAKNGIPVRKVRNYFPRQFSREALINGKQKILDHLVDGVGMPLEKARAFYNSLIDPRATDGRATSDPVSTPSFDNMNSRTARDKFFDQFLDENLDGIVTNYVNSITKRAEFNRVLGEDASPVAGRSPASLAKSGEWDPKGKYNAIIKQMRKENATDEDITRVQQYIDANLGQLGRDVVSPGARKFMAGVMGYQNMRVLLFTVFASLPDSVGPAIRSGDMRKSFGTIKKYLREIASDNSKVAEAARVFGIISSASNDHILTEYVDNHYMPPGVRKMNDAFFKWTGLNWYTDFTRKMALSVGIDYIQNLAEQAKNGTTEKAKFQAQDALAELGIDEGFVRQWVERGKPGLGTTAFDTNSQIDLKVAEALSQFVDESIMRPNAAQRPLMASHPAAMLVYHLKNYLYAVHEVVLKRIKFNVDEAEGAQQTLAAIAPALAMMMVTAVGLELREIVQYAGSNRQPPTDRMDGWEYTWELFERAGLTGITQLGFDFENASDRGLSEVAGLGGPTLSQVGQILSRPSTQTIPKAIPIVSQIPGLRNAVRTVL